MPHMASDPEGLPPAKASLRERRRKETAEAIIEEVLNLIAEAGIDQLTMASVAERAGVSLRTLYRYFPDRTSLLTAGLARHDQSVPFQSPTHADEIGAVYGAVFPRFDDTPEIVQAVVTARLAGSVRWEARSKRVREIEAALSPVCDHLPREQAENATAIIVYLANALAWLSLRDESGLDGHRSGAAITWAIDTLISDLEQRDQRASDRRGLPDP
jgi:AcrR family transcriptional regulator